MVDVAEELGVDAIGLNHLMFSTPEEVAETVRLIGATGRVGHRDVRHARSRARRRARARARSPRSRAEVPASATSCSTIRPKVHTPLMDELLHAGREARGPLPVSVPARARVVFRARSISARSSGSRSAICTKHRSKRSGTASGTSRCASRLLEHGIFPVCRRCCKVELSPEPAVDAQPTRRRRAPRDSADGGALT